MTRVDRFELLTADSTRETLHAQTLREEHPDMFESQHRASETEPTAVYHYREADFRETLVIAPPDYRIQIRKYDPMLFPTFTAAFDWCYSTMVAANSTGRQVGIRSELAPAAPDPEAVMDEREAAITLARLDELDSEGGVL